MIFCKELNKEFADKKEMFKALKANKDHIIGLKKAAIKFSDPVGYEIKIKGDATKAEDGEDQAITFGSKVWAVINSTNWLDSHGDVHIDGIWDVSARDQKGKLYYIINHELELGKVISFPDEVEPSVKTVKWSDIGIDYPGTTQLLLFGATLTEASNKDAFYAIANKKPIQNSVRMQYISMTLCINDSDPDFKQEYENFYKYLAVIANKEDAMEQGFFWAVTEAKIYKEGSAVLFGSNEATPILYSDPQSSSQESKIDPLVSSQEKKIKSSTFNLI